MITVLISIVYYCDERGKGIVNSTLSKFEDACYENNNEIINDLLSKEGVFGHYCRKDSNLKLKHLFNKFDRGFEIVSFTPDLSFLPIVQRKEILCDIRKIAKSDGKERDFGTIILIYENDQWKVFQYSFPDYLDYK